MLTTILNSSRPTTLGNTNESFPKSTDGSLEYFSAIYYDNYIFPGVQLQTTTMIAIDFSCIFNLISPNHIQSGDACLHLSGCITVQ